MKTPCEVLDTSCESNFAQPVPRSADAPGFFRAHWRGQQRLLSAFWGVGMLGTVFAVFVTLTVGLVVGSTTLGLGHLPPWTPLAVIWVPYLVFAWVSVWRCAPNADTRLWGYLAQGAVVVYVLAVARVVVSAAQLT